jgi:hypothetical protein
MSILAWLQRRRARKSRKHTEKSTIEIAPHSAESLGTAESDRSISVVK